MRATLGAGESYPPPYEDEDGPTNDEPGTVGGPELLLPHSIFFTLLIVALRGALNVDEVLKEPDDDEFGDADWGVNVHEVLGFVYKSRKDAGLGSDDICSSRWSRWKIGRAHV